MGYGLVETVPGFHRSMVITDAAHFSMQEQPEQVTSAMPEFFLTT